MSRGAFFKFFQLILAYSVLSWRGNEFKTLNGFTQVKNAADKKFKDMKKEVNLKVTAYDEKVTPDGRPFFVDHNTKQTQWTRPDHV